MNSQFIEFLVKNHAIRFGEFQLKSGRTSPYFISTGVLADGKSSYHLGKFYAQKINEIVEGEIGAIYGPAYKGIPLAVSTSIAMNKEFGKNVGWIFDRKEKKVHGDKGAFVGCEIDHKGEIIIVDDVMTTGGTKVEAIKKIEQSLGAVVKGIVIAVDREEIGKRKKATLEFEEEYGVPIYSIVKISEVFSHLRNRDVGGVIHVDNEVYGQFLKYKSKYGE